MGKNSLTGTSFGCRLWARKAQGLSAVTSEATALGPDLCPTAASQAQRSNGLSLCLLGWGLLGLEAAALGQQISILGTPGSPGTHGWRTRISGRGLGRTGEPHGAPRGQEGPGAQACLTWTTLIPAPAFIELSCVQQPSPHPEWEVLPHGETGWVGESCPELQMGSGRVGIQPQPVEHLLCGGGNGFRRELFLPPTKAQGRCLKTLQALET